MNRELPPSIPQLADGESSREICPMCEGGSTRERSLSCKRTGVVISFTCWRASCGYSGRVVSGETYNTRQPKKNRRVYDIVGVPDSARAVLESKVKSQSLREQTGYVHLTGRDAFAFPIFRSNGMIAGHVLRTYEKGDFPKALVQSHEYRGCAWWSDTESPKVIVIVEDIPSAAWLNDVTGIAAVALMGASLSEDKTHDILSARPSCIIVCLDPDALVAALDMANTLKARTDAMVLVHNLPIDIKDMSDKEVAELGASIENMIEEKQSC